MSSSFDQNAQYHVRFTPQVARVKNKWKCVLKDGMIHVNGKDYLFAKCNGYVTPV